MTCIAVIDVETTGLNPYRHDRVVELGVLVIRPDGTILRKYVTLVNPERDIGPTRLHGLTTRDILAAPKFNDIAGAFLDVLEGCVALAGHNIRFDHSFLAAEFGRLGYAFPDGPTLCTMQLAGGGNLTSACSDYGLVFEGEVHSAWHDVNATALLLAALLKDAPRLTSKILSWPPIVWPKHAKSLVSPMTRENVRSQLAEPPSYMQILLTRMQPELPPDDNDSAILAYTSVLYRALEDRDISKQEGDSLVEIAKHWAIPSDLIQKIHWDCLIHLGAAALADGVLSDIERRDLQQVALLLGIENQNFDKILEMAAQKLTEVHFQPSAVIGSLDIEKYTGKRVCFTGECQCHLKGKTITREMAAELAANRGMIVAESVTKKLDLLVVADPLTQSGKAKKARQYGIRIIHEVVFWKSLGLEVE